MRRVLRALLVLALVMVLANVAGIVRIPGGPLNYDSPLQVLPAWETADEPSVQLLPAAGATVDQPLFYTFHFTGRPGAVQAEWAQLRDATVELIDVRVAPASSDPGVFGSGTPDEWDQWRPLAGTAIDPEHEVLVALLRAPRPGFVGFRGLEIGYRTGLLSYTFTDTIGAAACVAPSPAGELCPPDEEDDV